MLTPHLAGWAGWFLVQVVKQASAAELVTTGEDQRGSDQRMAQAAGGRAPHFVQRGRVVSCQRDDVCARGRCHLASRGREGSCSRLPACLVGLQACGVAWLLARQQAGMRERGLETTAGGGGRLTSWPTQASPIEAAAMCAAHSLPGAGHRGRYRGPAQSRCAAWTPATPDLWERPSVQQAPGCTSRLHALPCLPSTCCRAL